MKSQTLKTLIPKNVDITLNKVTKNKIYKEDYRLLKHNFELREGNKQDTTDIIKKGIHDASFV